MRTILCAIAFGWLTSCPSIVSAADLKAKLLEQFNENCSAVMLTLITRRVVGNVSDANVQLKKGEKSRFIRLADFDKADPSLLLGQMKWHCGDTAERAGCDSSATHVRVQRAATGRATKFSCYRVESCSTGVTTLDTLDDRCREESLRVGGRLIKWLQTEKNIPYSSAKLNDSGGVRWTCGGTPERSNCPANTSLLTIERKDRDTGLFHIRCQRSGSQCEMHSGEYGPQ